MRNVEVFLEDGDYRITEHFGYTDLRYRRQYIEHRCPTPSEPSIYTEGWRAYVFNPMFCDRVCSYCKASVPEGMQACFWFVSEMGLNHE